MSYREHYSYWNSFEEASIKRRQDHFMNLLKTSNISTQIGKVLDVGCGDGVAILTMQQYGLSQISGIDVNEEQVAAANSLGVQAEKVQDPIHHMETQKNEFDLITLFDVIEHIPKNDQIRFLSAIYTALKPNGRILLTTPNANSSFASRYRYGDWTHHCSFTEHSLKYILHEAGFEGIKISPAEKDITILKSILKPYLLKNILLKLFRSIRRLEAILELGKEYGSHMPLSLNILATAYKKNEQ